MTEKDFNNTILNAQKTDAIDNAQKTLGSSLDSDKRNTTRIILKIAVFLLAAIIIIAWFYTESNYKKNEPIQLNTASLTLDQWYETGNEIAGFLGYNGSMINTPDESDDIIPDLSQTESLNTREPLPLPGHFKLSGDSLTIYRDCSPEEINRGILMVYNDRQQFNVKVDGTEIFSLSDIHENHYTSVNGYSLVKLEKTSKSQRIEITFSMCRKNECHIESLLMCTPSEALVHMASMDFTSFVMLFLLLILAGLSGCFCLYYMLKRIQHPRIVCLFILLVGVCLWILTNMWTSTLLPLSYQTIFHIDYTALMILPIPVAVFAFYSTSNYRSKNLLLITFIAFLNIIGQQVAYLWGSATFYDMLFITHGLLFITFIISMLSMMRDYRMEPSSHGFIMIATFIGPLLFFIGAIVLFWTSDSGLYNVFFLIGMGLFILMFTIDVAHSTLTNAYESRETQTKLEVFQLLSVKDGLTGLNNRRSFDEHLDKIDIATLDDAILIFMDVNRLKSTNDTYGHAAGDELIKSAADCISKAFGPYGSCYRLGGDEFAVIIENPKLKDQEYMDIFEETIKKHNVGRMIPLSIAKGYDHLFNYDHIRRNVSLWKSNADKEMYADKMRTKILLDKSDNSGIISENIDKLTGILTLEGFQRNALHVIYHNPKPQYALWYFDVKKFKFINDFFGYELGDSLIKYMGKIFLESIHEGETCGRISGNTIVVLTRVLDDYTVEDYFNYIQNAIGQFFTDSKMNYKVEIAAGVYLLGEEDKKCPDINQMLDWANVAQKSIKNLSGSRYAIFGEEMWQRQWRDLYINQSLEEAIENEDITVWLQPQYDFVTGKISGAEALARWTHNSLGWLSPAEFIPALEKTGQITKLDYYVWELACKLMHRWRLSNTMEPVSISINISRLDMMEGNILKRLNELTEKYDLPASCLRLEITESAYMDRPEFLIDVVNELHEHGYVVEMDDFGSGFSSLNMLKDVPVDLLKMDIRFLQGDSRKEIGSKIIGAIVQMSRELGIPVLSEGVENLEQARYLSSIGCSLMQGYYFSKPLPVNEFEDLLREEKKKNILAKENGEATSMIRPISPKTSDEVHIKKVFYAEYCIENSGRIVKCDRTFTMLTGYTVEDVTAQSLAQNDLIPPEDRDEYWETVAEQRTSANEVILNHRLLCKDGQIITVHCSGTPFIDEYSGQSMTRIRIQSTLE